MSLLATRILHNDVISLLLFHLYDADVDYVEVMTLELLLLLLSLFIYLFIYLLLLLFSVTHLGQI